MIEPVEFLRMGVTSIENFGLSLRENEKDWSCRVLLPTRMNDTVDVYTIDLQHFVLIIELIPATAVLALGIFAYIG